MRLLLSLALLLISLSVTVPATHVFAGPCDPQVRSCR